MESLTPDFVALLQYILPGLVSAWIYHRLTAIPRPSAFEAVVQALIFTGIIQTVVYLVRSAAVAIGSIHAFGNWSLPGEVLLAYLVAGAFGLFAVRCTSDDNFLFKRLRDRNLTSQASYPSEWFGAFKRCQGYVVLQLSDNRRLFGWTTEWPTDPKTGHVRLQRARWLKTHPEGTDVALSEATSILISVADIRWAEFVDSPQEQCDDDKSSESTTAIEQPGAARECASSTRALSSTAAAAAPTAPTAQALARSDCNV